MPLYKALDLGAEMPPDMAWRYQRYRVMREMNWSLADYNRAPAAFVAEVVMFLVTEARVRADKVESAHG